jgi:tetratricopeptide (TPR) repeat protein
MKTRSSRLLLLLPALFGAAAPCLWDRDTLAQERARFPSALELITGRFPRHSEAYYRWRIEDRERRLEAGERTPELLDDLAVAHSKLGDDARAIELMATKEESFPGLYETAANLGTFHIHAGELEAGIEHIVRAIRINPEAHFGREVYQEMLARYVLARREAAPEGWLPLCPEPVDQHFAERQGYWGFLLEEREVAENIEGEELGRAVAGVLGMMRFGNHDSPVLLEALSDLLLADFHKDGKRLAARALLKASYAVEDEEARARYREKARTALLEQTPTPRESRSLPLEDLEADLRAELRDAETFFAELEARERFWIEEGEDVDARFADVYFTRHPHVEDPGRERYHAIRRFGPAAAAAAAAVALIYLVTLVRRR